MEEIRCTCHKIVCQVNGSEIIIKCRHCNKVHCHPYLRSPGGRGNQAGGNREPASRSRDSPLKANIAYIGSQT